jgi:hypothetical protein
MRHGKLRRSLAAASATAMAGAALVVGGGVASAEAISNTGEVKGNATLGNRLEFKRTVSEKEVTYGDTVTITSEIIDSYGTTWWANTHSWIESNTPSCFDYVGDSPGETHTATWKAWNGDWETPSSKPGEFKPSANAIRIDFPVVVSDPLVLKADYVVKCDAGDAVATGGMSWKGTYGSSGDTYKNFGPSIKVNRASVDNFFLHAPATPEVSKPTTLTVDTDAPEGSTITFSVDGQTLTGTVAGGTATATWTPSSSGSKTIKATFAGTATHVGKETQRTVTVAAQTVDSTVTLDVPGTAQVGQTAQLKATVSPQEAGGTVTFRENGTDIATVSVPAGGIVTTDWIPGTAGSRTIDAVFSGRSGVRPGTAVGQSVQVAAAPVEKVVTKTSVSPIPMTLVNGTVTLEAKVDTNQAGGTITFYDGNTELGTVDVGQGGVATYAWTPTTEGERTIRAVFSGTDTAHQSQGTANAIVTSATDVDPEDPTDPGTPGGNTGSLGSLTGLSSGGTNGGGSLGSLGS